MQGYLWSERTIGYTSPAGNVDEIVIYPNTVCQYTGMKDKNGVKIFENDLVEYKYKHKLSGRERTNIYTVEWDENGYSLFDYEIGFRSEQITVVGNVYDDKVDKE